MKNLNQFVVCPAMWIVDETLSSNELRVLLYLRLRQGQNGEAWPGLRTIAEDCHLAKHTIIDILDRLQKNKRIVITEKGKCGRGHSTKYTVNLPEKKKRLSVKQRLDEEKTKRMNHV